ncbi:MAG: PadR family transcriptional regulator [Deltaproteobacteria bacterium]|nr:PadR family transcriptional regulator [Deltaproteobacteria bacterium]
MPAEYALLGLLQRRPMHGYQLAQQFAADSPLGRIVRLERSLLYALLKKLEAQGQIRGMLQTAGLHPPRRVFSLTPAGRQALERWAEAPVEHPREIRLEFLLKLYFAQELGPATVLRLIEGQIVRTRAYLQRLRREDRETRATTAAARFDHIVWQVRIRQIQSIIEWLDWCRQAAGRRPERLASQSSRRPARAATAGRA